MSIKTALITALLTTSTAAMASPGGVTVSASAQASFSFGNSSPVVRDHRPSENPYAMPTTTTRWSTLSAPLQLRTGMDVVRLQGRQQLSQIRLQASAGHMQVDRVTVRFLDGTQQTVRMGKLISAANPMAQLDLHANRSGVESISIIGRGGRRASYQVFAQATRFELPPRPVVVDFSGAYTSEYGDVFLTQVGNRIYGTYPGNGTLDGYVTNGVAVLDSHDDLESGNRTGRATFTVGANGKLEGMGRTTNMTSDVEWDLYRKSR